VCSPGEGSRGQLATAVRIEAAEEEYQPEGPPMSPITRSYFLNWTLFDLTIGTRNESLGSCVAAISRVLGSHPGYVAFVEQLCRTRPGIYVHEGPRIELPHTPRGLVPFFFPDGRVEYARFQTANSVDSEMRAMAKLLERRLTGPVLRGEPVSAAQREGLGLAFQAALVCKLDELWAHVLVHEIGNAKRDKLADEATRVRRAKLAWEAARQTEQKTLAHPTKTTFAGKAEDESGKTVRTKIESEKETATINGDECAMKCRLPHTTEPAVTTGELVDAKVASIPYDARARAQLTLDETKRSLAELSPTLLVPGYADDVELTEWSTERMGFEGGGGSSRAIKGETLADLYLHSKDLAEKVEAHAMSIASPTTKGNDTPVDPPNATHPLEETSGDPQLGEDEDSFTVQRLLSLAQRVRRRANISRCRTNAAKRE
jgi:hypothetical protein